VAACALMLLPPGIGASPLEQTRTPIKHLVVIIGENRTFDHVFATYRPAPGESVWNLLSRAIVTDSGAPGPNFAQAQQQTAVDPSTDAFLLGPGKRPFPGDRLPPPLVGGPKDSYVEGNSLQLARESENGLPDEYYRYLVSGGTGLEPKTADIRIDHVQSLPAGPFQLTNGKTLTYHDYTASPAHRFYQMWQQLDCNVDHATTERPSGCDSQLFAWVAVTVGHGSNGRRGLRGPRFL
jgi:phospholipase C